MREYHLVNENNVRYSLRDFQLKAFIPSLKGLGYKKNITFVKVGNYFKTDNSEVAQGIMSGTVVFSDYLNYRALVDFVQNASSLRLIYKPLNIEYFRDVEISSLSDLLEKGSTLECEIAIDCKSLWYTSANRIFEITSIDGESRYPLRFGYTFNDYNSGEVLITNNGHSEAELMIQFFGYIKNPKIELYQNDVKLYTIDFTKEVLLNEQLIYSARDGQNYCVFETGGVQTNAVSVLSLEDDNFFRLPKGTSKIVISSDTGLTNKITFTIFTAYMGV